MCIWGVWVLLQQWMSVHTSHAAHRQLLSSCRKVNMNDDTAAIQENILWSNMVLYCVKKEKKIIVQIILVNHGDGAAGYQISCFVAECGIW